MSLLVAISQSVHSLAAACLTSLNYNIKGTVS